MREELIVFITAMLPIAELRGALPLALEVYGFSIPKAVLLSIIGNIIPVFFILWWINPVSIFLSKHSPLFKRFFYWLFERTRRKYLEKHQRVGDLALILFVAIPLPVTGAWTGALAAWLFGIKTKNALFSIFIGLIIAAIIVTSITLGISLAF